jgi:hypothetical protein
MSRACSQAVPGTRDGAGDGDYPSAPLREAQLPVRQRRERASVDCVVLLGGEQDEVRDAAGGPSRRSASSDRGVPDGQGPPDGSGQCRAGRAFEAAQGSQEAGGLSRPNKAERLFERSDALYAGLAGFMRSPEAALLAHDELEARLVRDGRELQRQLLQDHFDLRALKEQRLEEVRDAESVAHNRLEAGHERALTAMVGTVTVSRLAYRAEGRPNLHPADAALNLPTERYSYGLRELAAIESTRGSYQEAADAICRATGIKIGKRQVEQLVERAASHVESFYASRDQSQTEPDDVLVISADGKGIAMRPEALRPATAKKAESSAHKIKGRLSKGEKNNRTRMAELVVVYDSHPVPRHPEDVFSCEPEPGADERQGAPSAKNKWLSASVVEDASSVLERAFDEAERRDPDHERTWVGLVDGNNHQIRTIKAEAKSRNIDITVVVDVVHVLQYLWGSVWCFFDEGDPAAETWVIDKARAVLDGDSSIVAASIRRKATYLGLDTTKRKKADEAANYLLAKRPYLDYPTALANGWPIATGVIEGAVRHIVKDRMGLNGARWGLEGAEAVLKLRAVRANGDWDQYWSHHKAEERRRVHHTQYLNSEIQQAA